MARRGYPPEFRRRVVELVEGGRNAAIRVMPAEGVAYCRKAWAGYSR